jgi:hypothetical protein
MCSSSWTQTGAASNLGRFIKPWAVHRDPGQRRPGTNQPTLDDLGAIAVALSVTADSLVFGDTESGPQTENLRLRMEALDHLPPDPTNKHSSSP